jgi:hypothetical protein
LNESQDPACKTAFNWVNKIIRQMTRRKTLEWWETRTGNCEVTPQAIWPLVKSLTESDGPKVSTTIHGTLGLKFHPSEKANMIADCLENLFTPHDLCDENHEKLDAAGHYSSTLLKSIDNNPLKE